MSHSDARSSKQSVFSDQKMRPMHQNQIFYEIDVNIMRAQ